MALVFATSFTPQVTLRSANFDRSVTTKLQFAFAILPQDQDPEAKDPSVSNPRLFLPRPILTHIGRSVLKITKGQFGGNRAPTAIVRKQI